MPELKPSPTIAARRRSLNRARSGAVAPEPDGLTSLTMRSGLPIDHSQRAARVRASLPEASTRTSSPKRLEAPSIPCSGLDGMSTLPRSEQ